MPNWVKTRVTTEKPETISALLGEPTEDESTVVDFNKIIPTPDHIYQGNLGQKEREEYGENNWYDWNTANWGTKWNASNAELHTPTNLSFETAWSLAIPVIVKLSELHPEDTITVVWADEDLGGNNHGALKIKAGEVFEAFDPEDVPESVAVEFAAHVWWGSSHYEDELESWGSFQEEDDEEVKEAMANSLEEAKQFAKDNNVDYQNPVSFLTLNS